MKYTENESICNKHVLMNAKDERGSDYENLGDIFVISGKWLVVFLEILLNSRVPVGISVDRGLISDKSRGFFEKWQGISAGDLFFNRKYRGGSGPRCVDWVA
jgi:hypothetical protein